MRVSVGAQEAAGSADPVRLMTTGGDERILLDPDTGLNRYHSAPCPRDVLAYASSTANDISPAAFAFVAQRVADSGGRIGARDYEAALEELRKRIRRAYGLNDEIGIVFAPSGTDLEYVALAAVAGRGEQGTHNILLGADEVGSGCIHSAHGRHFAARTALGVATEPGTPVAGLSGVALDMIDVKVRDDDGRVRPSRAILVAMDEAIAAARAARRHTLVHVVHGSKTGLILPGAEDLDRLQRAHGDSFTLVVDACQGRITGAAIADYLERGAILFLTGSKFMGGPPFSGFALVPPAASAAAPPLPQGFAGIFRRGEWPRGWPGREILTESGNFGLLLRLEAAILELERFQALDPQAVERVILAFHAAIRSEIIESTKARRVAPYPPGESDEADSHPIEMRSLSTLDLTGLGGGEASFEDAVGWHKALLDFGIRLGQPVKCVRLRDGSWGATLRIGLSMPQVTERAGLNRREVRAAFDLDMARIAAALQAVAGEGPRR